EIDHLLHLRFQFGRQAQAVVEDHGLEVVESAFEGLAPDRGALQLVGGADVEHQEAIDDAHQGFIVQVGGKQLGVTRAHAAVAGDVEVPAALGGDHPDILALRLSALAGAAGDAELDLVRCSQALVAVFQAQSHADAVLHTVAAPSAADAGLHRAQGFAVGGAGLEAGFDQLAPDLRQFVQLGAEQVDTLAARGLGVEVAFFRYPSPGDQPVRRAIAAGDTRHHRIGAVLLHVGHEGVVGVLQRDQQRIGDRLVPTGSQDRAHRRLADIATDGATAMFGQQLVETEDAFDANDAVQLLAGMGKVLAKALVHRNAARGQLVLEDLFEQRTAAAATGAGLGRRLQLAKVGNSGLDLAAHRTFADVVARADGGGI